LLAARLHVGVLTNSTGQGADAALAAARLRERFEVVIGSDEVQKFKPHPRVYEHAVERLQADPGEIALIAAHGWDVMGAMRVGLRRAWLARSERCLVPVLPEPGVRGDEPVDVAGKIEPDRGRRGVERQVRCCSNRPGCREPSPQGCGAGSAARSAGPPADDPHA
jgi:2-haloacid dehalogenase